MAIVAIPKRFNFYLKPTRDSDLTMSGGSWFQKVIFHHEKKCTIIRVPGDIGDILCAVCIIIS